MDRYELMCCIVDDKKGSRVLKVAKRYGITGGTIYLGRGTAKNKLLELLDLDEVHKEIVWMVGNQECTNKAMEAVGKEMYFHEPGHGIAFSIPVTSTLGIDDVNSVKSYIYRGDVSMHNALFIVVEKGKGEEAVDLAKEAGARGATIWNGRGSGVHESEVLFAMPIEPEKEIVLIITSTDKVETISNHVANSLNICEPGNGVIFALPVTKTIGIM